MTLTMFTIFYCDSKTYFRDCETYFGKESLQPITKDDSVICDTQFSKVVPLEGGEVIRKSQVLKLHIYLSFIRFSVCN